MNTLADPINLILAVTHRLPRVPGAGRLAQALTRLATRRKRGPVEAHILGARMRLDPNEFLEQVLLFYPQFWDPVELAFLRARLRPGHTFLDVGAHVGFYSLAAARAVGTNGRVLAIEAAPETYAKLSHNLHLNALPQVIAVNEGVSDAPATLTLGVNTAGNRAANSFLFPGGKTVEVPCRPLLDILDAHGLTRIRGAKFDIEGFEYRVLRRFLTDAPVERWPEFIIIERNPDWVAAAGGDSVALLQENGYQIHAAHDENFTLVRPL